MIHIATVHWQTTKWIDIQLNMLERFINSEYRIYGFLPTNYTKKAAESYHYISSEAIESHAVKLNLLADIISAQANPEDILIFLDGDAFPVQPIDNYLRIILSENPLAAIKRLENLNDQQPHPSFCATTVGFWNQISGDWKMGYCWPDSTGQLITDVGGNLLGLLEKHKTNWRPILRSHSLTQHPVAYGIYDGKIYHHSAGFRAPIERTEVAESLPLHFLQRCWSFSLKLQHAMNTLYEGRLAKRAAQSNKQQHDEIFKRIKDEEHWLKSLSTAPIISNQ